MGETIRFPRDTIHITSVILLFYYFENSIMDYARIPMS